MVTQFLTGVSLYEMPGSLFREAGLLPGADLRSLDALHLAVQSVSVWNASSPTTCEWRLRHEALAYR